MEAQREAVSRYVARRGEILAEFIEVESGREVNRPQLLAALAECRRERPVDPFTLSILELIDRLLRDAKIRYMLVVPPLEICCSITCSATL